jgi:uncharacterized HhH-GPD family protein
MMLDQQIRMEIAFLGPQRLAERLGIELSPARSPRTSPEDVEAAFRVKPAIHRFPGAMAGRVRQLAEAVVDGYDGDAEAIWRDVDATRRCCTHGWPRCPGFGDEKASIFMALLAKQLDVRPRGWEAATGEYALDGYRSIADVTDTTACCSCASRSRRRSAPHALSRRGGRSGGDDREREQQDPREPHREHPAGAHVQPRLHGHSGATNTVSAVTIVTCQTGIIGRAPSGSHEGSGRDAT